MRILVCVFLIACMCARLNAQTSSSGNVTGGAKQSPGNGISVSSPQPPQLNAGDNEEHLLKVQETILGEVEKSNERTQRFIDRGIMVVGIVGSLVLAVFAFFGLNTAIETRKLRSRAETLIKELQDAIAEARKTRQDIADQALAVMTPKLAAIANYGMTMASFATASWSAMSVEDRVRFCQEASDAIEAAQLGAAADAARSFVLARHGSALYDDTQFLGAAEKFKASCAVNVMRRPDRPYNLACAYVKLSQRTAGKEAKQLVDQAFEQLEQCIGFSTDGSVQNTVSKQYYKGLCLKDPDLAPIQSDPRVLAITK